MRGPSSRGLLFGPLAATILWAGFVCLPLLVPGYSSVRQTVSEIGEVGSPARVPFTIMLLIVAACLWVFAFALHRALRDARCPPLPAYLVGFATISLAGVGCFAYPHPLHNVFGVSELVFYPAPLAFAMAGRRVPRFGRLIGFSWFMAGLVALAIVANLATFDRGGALFAHERQFYGLVQRALFATWFGWVAVAGAWLYRGRHPGDLTDGTQRRPQ